MATSKPSHEERRPKARPGRDGAQTDVPYPVRLTAAWTWRALVIAAGIAGSLWLMGYFKTLVVPVLVAVLLTVLLRPIAQFLIQKLRFPNTLAAAVTVLGLLAAISGLLAVAGREIVTGVGELWAKAQDGFEEALRWLAEGPFQVSDADLDRYLDQITETLGNNSSTIVSGAMSATVTIGHVLAGFLITLFCLFFFVLEGDRIWAWCVKVLPRSSQQRVHQAAVRGWVTLRGYARMQIIVAAVDGIGIGLGAALLGIPLAIPLGILVFVGSFIPIVGAVLTGAVAVLVGLVDQGPIVALIMLGVVLAVQQIEGNVLQPFLMGRAVSLHPVAVLLAVAAGTMAAGIIGALFAVPLAALLNTVFRYLFGTDPFPELAQAPESEETSEQIPQD
ncbi:MAG TPA: AI-2E family transporter [Actinomycetales bacterium]|nr:AI-2E family transporter [Actinomycetales bacterium]